MQMGDGAVVCRFLYGGSLLEWFTPGKINMEPEATPLEKEKHLPNYHFQVLC